MININLIAERRAKRLREMNIIRWSSMAVVLVLVSMIVINVYASYILVSENNTQVSQKETLASKQASAVEYDKTQHEIDLLKPHINLIKQVRVSEAAWMIILADISHITPPDVTITNISVNSTEKGVAIKMGGFAKDEETVGKYMVSLSKTSWAANEKTKVGSISIEPGPDKTVTKATFDVTVPVAGMVGGDL